MQYFIAILIGLLAYVLVKLVVEKVDSLRDKAEVIGFIAGILVALAWVGAIPF